MSTFQDTVTLSVTAASSGDATTLAAALAPPAFWPGLGGTPISVTANGSTVTVTWLLADSYRRYFGSGPTVDGVLAVLASVKASHSLGALSFVGPVEQTTYTV